MLISSITHHILVLLLLACNLLFSFWRLITSSLPIKYNKFILLLYLIIMSEIKWVSQVVLVIESACQCRRHKRHGCAPWSEKIPGEGNGSHSSVPLLPREFQGRWNLEVCSPQTMKSGTWPSHWAEQQQEILKEQHGKCFNVLLLFWTKCFQQENYFQIVHIE